MHPPRKVLIKFLKETCNMVVILQHPGEDTYLKASCVENGGLTLMDAPPMENVKMVETPLEGIVEDATDSDSEGARQVQPQNKKHESGHGMPYDLNHAVITYQFGD